MQALLIHLQWPKGAKGSLYKYIKALQACDCAGTIPNLGDCASYMEVVRVVCNAHGGTHCETRAPQHNSNTVLFVL